MILKSTYLLLLILLFPILSDAQNPVWQRVAPGIWKAVVGVPDSFDLLKASGVLPYQEGLARLEKFQTEKPT